MEKTYPGGGLFKRGRRRRNVKIQATERGEGSDKKNCGPWWGKERLGKQGKGVKRGALQGGREGGNFPHTQGRGLQCWGRGGRFHRVILGVVQRRGKKKKWILVKNEPEKKTKKGSNQTIAWC